MPISEVAAPDGRIFEIEHPEGASEDDILGFAQEQFLSMPMPGEPEPTPVESIAEQEEGGFLDAIGEFGTRFAGAAETTFKQAPAGLQGLFSGDDIEEDQDLVERNRAIALAAREDFDPAYDDSFGSWAAEVLGGTSPFFAPAVAGAAIGSVVPGIGTVVGGGVGLLGGLGLGVASRGAEYLEEGARAMERGVEVSPEDYAAGKFGAGLIGATEALPVARALRLLRPIKKDVLKDPKALDKVMGYLKEVGLGAGAEALQESGAGLLMDVNLQKYIDPDIEVGESFLDDAAAGGFAGAVIEGMIGLVPGARRTVSSRKFAEEEERALRELEEIEAANDAERMSQQLEAEAPIKFDDGAPIAQDAIDAAIDLDSRAGYSGAAIQIARSMGDAFPTEPVFSTFENTDGTISLVGTEFDGISENKRVYATVPAEKATRLAPFVHALNARTSQERLYQNNEIVFDESGETYSQGQRKTLHRIGRSVLGPAQSTYSSDAVNYAGNTTAERGFQEELTAEEVIDQKIPARQQTVAQKINVKRLKKNLPETNRFTIAEVQSVLGEDTGNLAEFVSGVSEAETYRAINVNGNPAISVDQQGNQIAVINDRPTTKAERQADREAGRRVRYRTKFTSPKDAQDYAGFINSQKGGAFLPSKELFGDFKLGRSEIAALLNAKNITSDVGSKEIKKLAQLLTGRKLRRDQGLNSLSNAELQLFYHKLRQLPRFESPTKLPFFEIKPYTKKQIQELAQYRRDEGVDMDEMLFNGRYGPTTTADYNRAVAAARDLAGVEPIAALPSPSMPSGMSVTEKDTLEKALNDRLQSLGLSDIKGVITNLVRTARRDRNGNVILGDVIEGADTNTEGAHVRSARVIQISLDSIMADPKMAENVDAAIADILNHEVIHALRTLDLITQSELELLERLATKYKKADTGQTYVEWASRNYPELGDKPTQLMEEAVAEMVRDGIAGRVVVDSKPTKLSGKPASIIKRILGFFKGILSAVTDTDSKSFSQFLNDLETGVVGARERGEIRTLARLEATQNRFIGRQAPIQAIIASTVPEAKEGTLEQVEEQPAPRPMPREVDAALEEAGLGDVMFSRRSDLPPASNAQRTQIAGTLPTYRKAADILNKEAGEGTTLDFGAGLGLGAQEFGYDSYEPFPREGFNPTYTDPQEIPANSYDRVVNLNVLNVVPRDIRDNIVKDIGTALAPNGTAIITTRGSDVMAASGQPGPEPMSVITSRDTYQKGFKKAELVSYLQDTLGDGFVVRPLNLGPAGAIITKTSKSGYDAPLSRKLKSLDEAQKQIANLNGKSGVEAARWIESNASNASYRAIAGRVAEKLESLDREGAETNIKILKVGDSGPSSLRSPSVKGVYTFKRAGLKDSAPGGDVYMMGAEFDRYNSVEDIEEALLHELIHAATNNAISIGSLVRAEGTSFSDFANSLIQIGDLAVNRYKEMVANNEFASTKEQEEFQNFLAPKLANQYEVLAYGMTNQRFQEFLESIPMPAQEKYGAQNLFDRFIGAIRDFLGLSPREDTALSNVVTQFARAMTIPEGATTEIYGMQGQLGEGPAADISFSKMPETKHGISTEYIVTSRGKVTGKPAMPKAVNPANVSKQIDALAGLEERNPDPLSSKAAWLKFERDLLGDNQTPAAPTGMIDLYNDMDRWVEVHSKLTSDQINAAAKGFELVEEMSEAYESGDATVDTTGKLMLWGMLSRMLSASPHESAFLDASFSDKLSEFIARAVDREWTKADVNDYLAWAKTVIPEGSPGKSGTSNLNDFGKVFLPKMSMRSADGRSMLEVLHSMIADKSIPSKDVRAAYYGLGKGLGIQNKVLSFVMLMSGRQDVVILDRIQINSMWDAGKYGKLIYDDIVSIFDQGHGLARYEALERSLANKVGELYRRVGRPEDASVGRYHWESWVRDSGQVVSHPTIKGLISDARNNDIRSSYADIGAPEGRFHTFAFGSVYARGPDGSPYILYPTSDGTIHRFGLTRFKEFLDQVKKPAKGVIPRDFKVKEYREAGYPWYEAEGVNRAKLDQLISDFSEGAVSTESVLSGDVKLESDSVVARKKRDRGDSGIAFSRRGAESVAEANRNVEQASQAELDKVLQYAQETDIDPIGMATLQAGPMAFSIRSGYSDQDGYVPTFTTPSRSWFDRLVFQVQDKLTDLKDIEEAINESRAARGLPPLPISKSAYVGEETLAGKIGNIMRIFDRNEVEPLVKEMTESGVTVDQVDEFLVFRHAIERNERVRKINPSIPDAGAGKWNGADLTDAYVQDKMLSMYGMRWNPESGEWVGGNERAKVMNRIASRIDKISSTTLAISQKGGLITEQDRAFLDNYYKYYAPLRGISQEEDMAADSDARTAGSGGSLSIIGKEFKRAMGRRTEAVSPLATIISERGTQVARATKNSSFGKRLVDLIRENPNDEVWRLITPEDPQYRRAFESVYTYVGPDKARYGERKRDISGEADKKNWVKRVKLIQDPILNPYAKELMGVKVDGKQYYVYFENADLRKAAINLDAESVGVLVNTLNGFTRFMSYVNTSLNPEFVISNFARDIQTAIYNIIGEQTMEGGKAVDAKGIVGSVLKNTLPSMRVFYKGYRDPGSLTGDDATNFNEFMRSGAKTDWYHSKPPEQQKRNIEQMVNMASGTFTGGATKAYKAVKDFVDDTNSAVENGVRLATFVAARDAMIEKGVSRDQAVQQAATLSKNLTVNFNRRGNSGQLLNGLYLFFNASVQGTANLVRGLNVLDPNSSRTKQAIIASLIGFGAMSAALADWLMDDEEFRYIDEYIRDRSIIIPSELWGEKGAPVTIPLPYGYNLFHNMGENAYLVSSGQMSPEDAAIRLTNVFLGSFSPLGTSTSENWMGSMVKTATPTIVKPALELAMNENYFGSPIYKPDSPFGDNVPLSRRAFSNTSGVWKTISETVSDLTGGNESEPGYLEIPPEAFSYLIGYGLGGAGSFAERTFMKAPEAILDETVDLEVRDIPFVRRVMTEVSQRPKTEQFYDRRETLMQKERQMNDVLRGAERGEYIKENKPYVSMMPVLNGTEKQIRGLRKTLKQIREMKNVSPERAIELAEREKRIQDNIDKIINRFNARYDEVVGKAN